MTSGRVRLRALRRQQAFVWPEVMTWRNSLNPDKEASAGLLASGCPSSGRRDTVCLCESSLNTHKHRGYFIQIQTDREENHADWHCNDCKELFFQFPLFKRAGPGHAVQKSCMWLHCSMLTHTNAEWQTGSISSPHFAASKCRANVKAAVGLISNWCECRGGKKEEHWAT